MADKTKIEWSDATWNPIRARAWDTQSDGSSKERLGWHCTHVSEGCRFCYAESMNRRLGTGRDFKPGAIYREVRPILDETMLAQPLRWKKPRMIFVCSMTDLFGEWVPDEWIDKMFAVMALCPHHTFQILTKRPARMREYITRDPRDAINGHAGTLVHWDDMPDRDDWPMKNVWLGTSAEDQDTANKRIPEILATPAAIRFVSAEPLLGAIDFESAWHGESALDSECWGDCGWCSSGKPALHNCRQRDGQYFREGKSGIDQVIVGGESGPGARPMHPDWARSIRDQCAEAGTAFLFKQWGEWHPCEWSNDGPWYPMPGHEEFASWNAPVYDENSHDGWNWRRLGKKRAGRLLDGVEHNGFPEVLK